MFFHPFEGDRSMRIRLLSFTIAAVCLIPLLAPAQDKTEKTENPYKKAKVGDYVSYKMTTAFAGQNIEATMKQSVTAVSDTEVTVKIATMLMGMDLPAQTTKIDLTKPYDPIGVASKGKGKFEKKGEGKEKIKVGDKTYDCNWISGKMVAEAMGKTIESDIKVWFSKSVPLAGMVKMDMKSNLANVDLEISGSGNDK
jgi:hypothetical protein